MVIKSISFILLAVLLCVTANADAKEAPKEVIRAKLEKLVPGVDPDRISATPVSGLYEVVYGARVLYFSQDGRYMIDGNIIDIDQRTDLTEQTRNGIRKVTLDKVPEKQMIIFAPKNPKHTITVFTDVDCTYCRRLHAEIDQYNDLGIKVRYLMFPRTGVGSKSFQKAQHVWCADDPNQSMTQAKQGKTVDEKSCNDPIEAQFKLGQEIGITGTPAIVLEDGHMIAGYRPAKEIGQFLDGVEQADVKQ
jgi:thiol:disulfide interchange protein DsbC